MSYILDALQRADEERNLGEVPKLNLSLQSAPGQRQSRWPTILLILFLSTLVAVTAWMIEQGVFSSLFGTRPQVVETSVPTTKQPAAAESTTRTIVREPPVPAPVTRVESKPAPTGAQNENPPAGQPGRPEPAEPQSKPAAPVMAEPAAEKPVSREPEPEPENRSPRLPTPTVAPAPPPSWVHEDATRIQPRERSDESLQSYLALSKAFRDSMPALNMSAHVFSTNPARSFVLINNKRYHIGDNLEEGPEVTDILPDGAVLEYRGETFLLPVQR